MADSELNTDATGVRVKTNSPIKSLMAFVQRATRSMARPLTWVCETRKDKGRPGCHVKAVGAATDVQHRKCV